jgi:hypothetical protein
MQLPGPIEFEIIKANKGLNPRIGFAILGLDRCMVTYGHDVAHALMSFLVRKPDKLDNASV